MRPQYAFRIVRDILRHPMNRHHKTATLFRILQWQVRSRLNSQPVTVDYVNGSKLLVRRGMTAAIANIYNGISEYEDMAFVLHALRTRDLFVDVGANVGTFSILAALRGASVLAFEPIPLTFEDLMANVSSNRLGSHIEVRQVGISDAPGTLEFTTKEDSTNHVAGGAWPDEDQGRVSVEVTTLDDALGALVPTMLKIDVEGYESAVIRGARRTLCMPSLQAIIAELNGSGDRYGVDERKIHDTLLEHDFRPFDYDPLTRRLTDLSWETRHRSNILYVRDIGWARDRVANAPRFSVHGQSI